MIRLDLDLIRHALTTASDRGFASVEIGLGEDRFEAKLQAKKGAQKPRHSPEGEKEKDLKTISASAVGYFRSSAMRIGPGTEVKVGDVVAEIVALGLVNDVAAKWSGTIVEVLVKEDQPVEFGQAIAKLERSND